MAETTKTFPRIEVRKHKHKQHLVTIQLIDGDKTDPIESSVTSNAVDQVVAKFREHPRAGNCCPVYDYTKET